MGSLGIWHSFLVKESENLAFLFLSMLVNDKLEELKKALTTASAADYDVHEWLALMSLCGSWGPVSIRVCGLLLNRNNVVLTVVSLSGSLLSAAWV